MPNLAKALATWFASLREWLHMKSPPAAQDLKYAKWLMHTDEPSPNFP